MTDNHPAVRGKTKDVQKLKQLRKRLKMTQRDLAKEFYVSAGTVAHWESGKRSIPGPVLRLIEVYDSKK